MDKAPDERFAVTGGMPVLFHPQSDDFPLSREEEFSLSFGIFLGPALGDT
jgi:hypothetical protein